MRFPKSDPPHTLTVVVMAVLCLAAFPLAADEPGGEPPSKAAAEQQGKGPPRTVIKATRFVDVREVAPILEMLDVQIRLKPDVSMIVLRGWPDGDLETALKLIEALDEPSPSIEINVYILAASRDETGSAGISQELRAAVDKLQALFGYRGFKVLDTVFLRVLEGRAGQVNGAIDAGNGTSKRTGYRFGFNSNRVAPTEDGEVFVRLNGLHFELHGEPEPGTVQHARLTTDVEIREGQKAVVGKSTPAGTGDTLILIIEAKVLKLRQGE